MLNRLKTIYFLRKNKKVQNSRGQLSALTNFRKTERQILMKILWIRPDKKWQLHGLDHLFLSEYELIFWSYNLSAKCLVLRRNKNNFWKEELTHRASLGGLLTRPILVSRRPAAGHDWVWVRHLKRVLPTHCSLSHQILPQEVLNSAVYPSVQPKEYTWCDLIICNIFF